MAGEMMRVNFFYHDKIGKGWSETFYNSNTNYNTVKALAINLSTPLLNVRGTGVFLDEARVSDDSKKRDSLVYTPSLADSQTQNAFFLEGDFAEVALLCRLEATETNRRSLYLSGIPDVMTLDNGVFKPTPTWETAFDQLRQELFKNGWSQKCIVPPVTPNQIILITQNAVTGDISCQCRAVHGFTPGQLVNITGFRDTPGLNGRHIVKTATPTDTFSFKSKVFFTFAQGIGFASALTFNLKTFTRVAYERLVEHKRGKPIGSSVGRRSAG